VITNSHKQDVLCCKTMPMTFLMYWKSVYRNYRLYR